MCLRIHSFVLFFSSSSSCCRLLLSLFLFFIACSHFSLRFPYFLLCSPYWQFSFFSVVVVILNFPSIERRCLHSHALTHTDYVCVSVYAIHSYFIIIFYVYFTCAFSRVPLPLPPPLFFQWPLSISMAFCCLEDFPCRCKLHGNFGFGDFSFFFFFVLVLIAPNWNREREIISQHTVSTKLMNFFFSLSSVKRNRIFFSAKFSYVIFLSRKATTTNDSNFEHEQYQFGKIEAKIPFGQLWRWKEKCRFTDRWVQIVCKKETVTIGK